MIMVALTDVRPVNSNHYQQQHCRSLKSLGALTVTNWYRTDYIQSTRKVLLSDQHCGCWTQNNLTKGMHLEAMW